MLNLLNEHTWKKYLFISMLIHIAVVLVPVSTNNQAKNDRTIEVLLISNSPLSVSLNKKIDQAASSIKKSFHRIQGVGESGGFKRKEEINDFSAKPSDIEGKANSSISTTSLDERFVLRDGSQGYGGNGIAVQTGISEKAGYGTGIKGTGGGTGAGSGIGTGAAGSGTGNGSGIVDAKFNTPDGPKFQYREIPEYPFMARKLGKEGVVVLMVIIDEKGKLVEVKVIEASDQIFADAAIEAVKRSKFFPARWKGIPVPSRAILPIRFSLR
ncbi:MAG TPA: energy transducer TonB [Syntrophorhabdaceae bacterium]|nr:energy transducer TonB [Syntrophorhabdaceae bacterium]HPU29212.1 energy transducer TonB [Syntrophorhabdaceae bacterium]